MLREEVLDGRVVVGSQVGLLKSENLVGAKELRDGFDYVSMALCFGGVRDGGVGRQGVEVEGSNRMVRNVGCAAGVRRGH